MNYGLDEISVRLRVLARRSVEGATPCVTRPVEAGPGQVVRVAPERLEQRWKGRPARCPRRCLAEVVPELRVRCLFLKGSTRPGVGRRAGQERLESTSGGSLL